MKAQRKRIKANAARQDDKNPNAVGLGRLGGVARALSLTARQRKEIASMGGTARWARQKPAKSA